MTSLAGYGMIMIMNDNWIDKYIYTIINGPLPTIDVDTGEVIMQVKIDGVWQNEDIKTQPIVAD